MNEQKPIRIGTRESVLAIYQANEVKKLLIAQRIQSTLVEITSDGDLDLETPLYEMGIQGIFTKALDVALLQGKIDMAVHSAKDIPTTLAKGLSICALLERGTAHDCLVLPNGKKLFDEEETKIIASSSLRRRSQWLHRYPHHQVQSLRGNIQTRINKLDASNWDGVIMAQAAIERLEITTHHFIKLGWMLPSPAQGAVAVVCRENDDEAKEICTRINHSQTEICVAIERNFLAALQGGCAVPIAATATIVNERIHFLGNILSLDGKQKSEIELVFELDQIHEAGKIAATKLLRGGGEPILKAIRSLS